jgi:hypothetical protein
MRKCVDEGHGDIEEHVKEKVPLEVKKKCVDGKPSVWMENLVCGMKGQVDEGKRDESLQVPVPATDALE